MQKPLRKIALMVALSAFSLTAFASLPPGVSALEHLLSQKNGGKVTKVFRGPDGLTGVAIQRGAKHAIGYLTPNGQYFMVGVMINLATGQDAATEAAHKYLHNKGIITGDRLDTAVNVANTLSAFTIGATHSNNNITLVFDPDTASGKRALIDVNNLAHHIFSKNPRMEKILGFRFIPVGSKAAWILSGSNLGRIQRVEAMMKGQYPGQTTNYGQNLATKNNNALHTFGIKPPFVIVYFPTAKLAFMTSAKHAVKSMGGMIGGS